MTVPEELKTLKLQLEAVERGDEKLSNLKYDSEVEKRWVDMNLYLVRKGQESLIDFIIQLDKLIKSIELY